MPLVVADKDILTNIFNKYQDFQSAFYIFVCDIFTQNRRVRIEF